MKILSVWKENQVNDLKKKLNSVILIWVVHSPAETFGALARKILASLEACLLGFVPFFQLLHSFLSRFCSWRQLDMTEVLLTGPASVAHLDALSDWRPGGRGFNPRRGRQHSFVEIDHEIFSTVILSLPLIQEGQLSVSGERMCTILVNRLED